MTPPRFTSCYLSLGLLTIACSTLAASPTSAPDSTPAAKQAASASFGAVLQGDMPEALHLLSAVPESQYAGKVGTYRACMLERFNRETPPALVGEVADPFAHAVLATYQTYWWRALMAPSQHDAQTAALLPTLRGLIGAPAADAKDFNALEPVLDAELRKHGYHALQGVTPPLHELMLWSKQDTREYDVALPEGTQHVTVNFLDNFVSKGWSQYGSCGFGGTGGWTDDKAINALAPEYPDLQDENFLVSLLGHEAQHFADKQRRWKLEDWELEYRAKLTEFALANKTSGKLLQAFGESLSDDPAAPHPYANKRVLAALAEQVRADAKKFVGDDVSGKTETATDLQAVPLADLQNAAREVLVADTRRRNAVAKP
ncbi:MAG: hypothetical protein ABJA62_02695 [Luteimonas sp.]